MTCYGISSGGGGTTEFLTCIVTVLLRLMIFPVLLLSWACIVCWPRSARPIAIDVLGLFLTSGLPSKNSHILSPLVKFNLGFICISTFIFGTFLMVWLFVGEAILNRVYSVPVVACSPAAVSFAVTFGGALKGFVTVNGGGFISFAFSNGVSE